jgi:acetyl-CoA synthetase
MTFAKLIDPSTQLSTPLNAPSIEQYVALYEAFRWKVPKQFNIATVCSDRWERANCTAIIEERDGLATRNFSYRELNRAANRCANGLVAQGVKKGDRVAIILPQRFETAVIHMACYKVGAIAMPMSVLFGPEALEYRFNDSGAKIAFVDGQYIDNTRAARSTCKTLKHVIVLDAPRVELPLLSNEINWGTWWVKGKDQFATVRTLATDPCDLIYTSGTTGPPKGALIPHSAMIGNLTGFVASQNWFPKSRDVFWSPADWAWTGGLMDALLPSLYFGKPIVAYRGRFTAEKALEILSKHNVTNSFIFPTALKMIMKAVPDPQAEHNLSLRALMSAGESVGETLFNWCQQGLGVAPNEMFGQTELNYVMGNSSERWPARPGSIGRAYPGHRVAVIDDDGHEVPAGQLGEVAVNRNDIHGTPDPVFFIGYWNNPKATANKFTGDWCRTGDLATQDDEGYLWYGGRADDMFKAAGYRIGPSEIENCLVKHPAVANAAVVPKPDTERGAVVKAFIVLTQSYAIKPNQQQLIKELQQHVKGKLAPYEYPKEIEFVKELPMTTTGKVQRRVLRDLEEQRDQEQKRSKQQ